MQMWVKKAPIDEGISVEPGSVHTDSALGPKECGPLPTLGVYRGPPHGFSCREAFPWLFLGRQTHLFERMQLQKARGTGHRGTFDNAAIAAAGGN